jgi:hypothetical protein
MQRIFRKLALNIWDKGMSLYSTDSSLRSVSTSLLMQFGCSVFPTASLPIHLGIVHHLATFLIVLIPANLTQFSWHMGIALLVEFNTLFLMLKRNINKDSVFGLVFELMFYLSWIVLRLIMYPIFTVFIYYEYLRYSALVKSNINVMAGGFVLILFLTGLGFKWTVDMLIKMRGRTTTTTKNE